MFDMGSLQYAYAPSRSRGATWGREPLPFGAGDASLRLPQRPVLDASAACLARDARRQAEQFAAMAHELRMPLASMTALAKLLADNAEGNLSAQQVDYAQTLYSAATQLLSVSTAMLDLAQPECVAATPSAGLPDAVVKRQRLPRRRRDASLPGAAGTLSYRGPRSRQSDNGVVLIVESDTGMAEQMLGLVQNNGYRGEVAADLGRLRDLVRDARPDAVLLGMNLADSDGWTVFDLLKSDPETRRLPLAMAYGNGAFHACLHSVAGDAVDAGGSASPAQVLAGLGAVAGVPIIKLLLVDAAAEADAAWRLEGLEVTVVDNGAAAVDALCSGSFDAMVIADALADVTALDLLKQVVAAELAGDLAVAMTGLAGAAVDIAVVKRRRALDEVLVETTLFLHRAVGNRPPAGPDVPAQRRPVARELAGRKALIVDDDVRSIYAVTGALEQQGMIVVHAEDAAEGLEALRANPDVDVVLAAATLLGTDSRGMIGAVRAMAACEALPIIALTAAAPGERAQCLAAGASDSLDRPVNVEQLLSLLRIWLGGWR